jgi:phosphatidylglycerol lysyltransferase
MGQMLHGTTEVEQDVEQARRLVLRYGWNATAFQVVNPGICHWFTPDREAIVGYVERQGVRVVAGAPICAEDRLSEVITAFEAEARRAHQDVCYFGAAGRVMSLIGDCSGYSTVLLGAQPVWNPAGWADIVAHHASLRAQLARARNKGVTVEEWTPTKAHNHPALRRILNEWLETRTLPSLHFLVEPETLERLEGRRIFVALRQGEPIGFVNCSPVPARSGWLTEQFVRGRRAPNGTVELLLDAAIRAVAKDGATYVTMGLVPLSNNTWDATHINPLWLRWVLTWVRAHGQRFYNFAGLERFKAKFYPNTWETIYAVSNQPQFTPRILYAIAHAFSHRSPVLAVSHGIRKAARQEILWLLEVASKKTPLRPRRSSVRP